MGLYVSGNTIAFKDEKTSIIMNLHPEDLIQAGISNTTEGLKNAVRTLKRIYGRM